MSWLNRHPKLRSQDCHLLDFEPHPNKAFTVSLNHQLTHSEDTSIGDVGSTTPPQTIRKVIDKESDLEQWLKQISDSTSTGQTNNKSSTINLILASQMSSLDQLPFTQNSYSAIMNQMMMHRSIVRVINRNVQCTFSALPFDWSHNDSTIPSIVYNCRTAGSWEGDMALSVTFFPETLTTNAVWYGCDMKENPSYGDNLTDADIITGRLTNFDGSCFHPLILPTIFAEFERERHVGLVKKYMTQSVQRVHDLARPNLHLKNRSDTESLQSLDKIQRIDCESSKKPKTLLSRFRSWSRTEESAPAVNIRLGQNVGCVRPLVAEKDTPKPAALLWQNTSFLSNGLRNWQTQLRKMLQHAQDLDNTRFGISTAENSSEVESKLCRLGGVGLRIKTRIQDLIDEYDEYIRQCNHIAEGLRLATQLELNNIGQRDIRTNQEIARENLKVARMTRKDSRVMVSIAVLGMIFLPATFLSTFFSMDFIKQSEEDGKQEQNISYLWIYIGVSLGLTALTISIFYTCVLRAPSVEVDEESSCNLEDIPK